MMNDSTTNCDISVIVACEHDGRPQSSSIRHVEQAIAAAHSDGLSTEILRLPIVLGLSKASGKFVALACEKAVWSPNWLTAAFEFSKKVPPNRILHPALELYFKPSEHLQPSPYFVRPPDQESCGDQENMPFLTDGLFERNYWCFSPFASLDIFKKYPYSDLQGDLKSMSWAWNCQTIAGGAIHRVVPGTAVAINNDSDQQPLTYIANDLWKAQYQHSK